MRRCFRDFQGHAMRKRSVAVPSNYRYVMSSHSCASLCNYKSRTHHIKKWRALKVGPPEFLPQKAPSTGGWNPPWTVNHIFETFIIWTCWYNLHPDQKSTLAQTSFMVKEVAQNACICPKVAEFSSYVVQKSEIYAMLVEIWLATKKKSPPNFFWVCFMQ